MEEPLVSVVILNYNGLKDLRGCFDSLNNLSYSNKELILVDNNSQDKSVDFVKENYKDVKIIELKKNCGFAKGNNIGVSNSNGKLIVLLNNDTVVDQDWLTELVKVAISSKDVGVVGSKIYYYDKKKILNFAGSSNNLIGATSHIGLNEKDSKNLNQIKKIFYACGAAILFKRKVYEEIGLFDPNYFIYYEDVDFCWRSWMFGYSVLFSPNSFLYHKIGQVPMLSKRKRYLLERNKLRTLLKNYELETLRIVLPIFFHKWFTNLFDNLLFNRKNFYFWVSIYAKAIFWNLIHIKSLIKKRNYIQNRRKKSDKYIMKIMSITKNNN